MGQYTIRADRLGKKYRVGRERERQRYVALRDVLAGAIRAGARSFVGGLRANGGGNGQRAHDDFWALRDVSFEVGHGRVIGVIGRNGAGKSTLLKILSRITEPSEGEVRLRGRVVSLLEVGTGFHPELTGRENIFLNGAVLGLSKQEIRGRFDAIVDFAEVERFLDTPVKRYSSGMYVRLAFAVAAHLEPEILIVDEVLAVGDAEFQKKCLGKMRSVATGEGRTVLLVSHQLGVVRELCHETILLREGRIVERGEPADVIEKYLSQTPVGPRTITSRHVEAVEAAGRDQANVFFGEAFELDIALRDLPDVEIGVNVAFRNATGRLVCQFSTNPHDGYRLPQKSAQRVRLSLDPCCFAPGEYFVDIAVTEPAIAIIEEVHAVYSFEVHPRRVGGTWPYEARFGDVFPAHRWEAR